MLLLPQPQNSISVLSYIDLDEYMALKTDEARVIALIISSGFVNLSSGSNARIKIKECFPEETKTYQQLSKMIGESL